MNWDLEVDLVCTGAGAAGLATAISAVDLGGDVFVADASRGEEAGPGSLVSRQHPWLASYMLDAQTTDYLVALSSDLGPARRATWEAEVPISVVHDRPVGSSRTVAPFIGARLREWAARCLASPYGYLHTRISDWRTTPVHTADGETIEVFEVGSITPDPDNVGGSMLDWLARQARDRRIEIQRNCALQRIVFEEGEAVGAVFTTADGTLAIRVRHGVTISTNGPQVNAAAAHQLSAAADNTLRVCLVSRYASRFGRIELLTSEPVGHHPPSACRAVDRQLHVNLHEARGREPGWRCGSVDGYPSFG